MQAKDYFRDWYPMLDVEELEKVVATLNLIRSKVPIVPDYKNIFKAFTLCSRHDCKVVFLGQDFNKHL